MEAYLTFVRKNDNYLHLLGLKNPANIFCIPHNLISGQPILTIIKENEIKAFYLINETGELYQTWGKIDYLFEINLIKDLSNINIKKYNYIKNLLIYSFLDLSLQELNVYALILQKIENIIFYNYLHLEIDLFKIKNEIIKIIQKSDLNENIKKRILLRIKSHKIQRKLLRKKIDVDLSGYGINIYPFVS